MQGPEPPCLCEHVCVLRLSWCWVHHSTCTLSPDSGHQQKMPEGADASIQPCMLQSAIFGGETTSPTHPLFHASPPEPLTGLVGPSATPTTPPHQPSAPDSELQGSLYTGPLFPLLCCLSQVHLAELTCALCLEAGFLADRESSSLLKV